jgi:Uma2 family endonuclease
MTAARSNEREITLEEWAELDEDDSELVDGHLEEAEVPGFVHELVVMWFAQILRNWAASRGVLIAGSGAKYAVTAKRGRMPDVTVYLMGGPRPPARGVIRVPPSIAIEVITPTPRDVRRDRIVKLDEYAAFGVRWYWLLDPELRTFEIFELGADGRYVHALGATDGVIESVPGCEGLRVDLAALWGEIDALVAKE